jgi:hypothetical protein
MSVCVCVCVLFFFFFPPPENMHQDLNDHGILASYFQTQLRVQEGLCLQAAIVLLEDEDEGTTVLQNVSNCLPPDTM